MRFERRTVVHSIIACSMAVWLSGCGGLEKGPAPALPYTPEPPKPKTEKKAEPPALGPSTPIPIKIEPPATKKDGDAKKDEALKTSETKDVPAKAAAPATPDVKADEKKAPADAKAEPVKAPETGKGEGESKKE